MFFLIGLLMSVLSIFFLNSIVSEFVPGSIKIIHYPTQILEDIYNFAWASIAIYLPVLAVAFFASTSISSDLESRNIYQFMTMPISKEEYLLSKIISSFVASIISLLAFIAMQFITYILIFKNFPSLSFLNYVAVMVLIIFTDTTAAMAFSSIIRKEIYGPIGFILIFLLITNVLSLLISSMSSLNDSFIITNAQRLAYLVFLNVEPYFMVYTGSLSSISFNSELLLIYIQIAYTAAFLFILYFAFMRRGEVK